MEWKGCGWGLQRDAVGYRARVSCPSPEGIKMGVSLSNNMLDFCTPRPQCKKGASRRPNRLMACSCMNQERRARKRASSESSKILASEPMHEKTTSGVCSNIATVFRQRRKSGVKITEKRNVSMLVHATGTINSCLVRVNTSMSVVWVH